MHEFDRQTDKRTDGQTDRILIVRPRLHSMQRGKKHLGAGKFRETSVGKFVEIYTNLSGNFSKFVKEFSSLCTFNYNRE